MHFLVDRSFALIEAGQSASGAIIASPNFPNYRYCWFRDGTFIAHSMDLWKKYESAERFYSWAARTVNARSDAIERCLKAVAEGRFPDAADLLDTRYTLDGERGDEAWTNFQLDGFGTLLWGLRRHLLLARYAELPASWGTAASLLVRYLSALWQHPNYDCWEEFPEHIAVSTLAALYAGLHAIAPVLDAANGKLAEQTAAAMKTFTLQHGVLNGHLIKHISNGTNTDAVDASLLWACVPFGEHGLLTPNEPLMCTTVARIEADLIGATGGVHRYRADTYYGGGEWMLLTALLGEYRATTGDLQGARQCLEYIEKHADAKGKLPEQSYASPMAPDYVEPWLQRWGPVANPLLWSHGAYLGLCVSIP